MSFVVLEFNVMCFNESSKQLKMVVPIVEYILKVAGQFRVEASLRTSLQII
jgi:hypothetical protein